MTDETTSDTTAPLQPEDGGDQKTGIEEDIRSALRSVKDPEIDLNIIDLGLVYDVEVIEGKAFIQMTLTSPGCPAGPEIVGDVERCVGAMDGIESVRVEIVWEPFWSPERIDPRIRSFLGM